MQCKPTWWNCYCINRKKQIQYKVPENKVITISEKQIWQHYINVINHLNKEIKRLFPNCKRDGQCFFKRKKLPRNNFIIYSESKINSFINNIIGHEINTDKIQRGSKCLDEYKYDFGNNFTLMMYIGQRRFGGIFIIHQDIVFLLAKIKGKEMLRQYLMSKRQICDNYKRF
jgi:hypothetical protein